MYHHTPTRQLAKAVRLGDLDAANRVLDGQRGFLANEVSLGRADADQALRKDPPLPRLARSQDDELADLRAKREAEAASRELNDRPRSKRRASAC
jgi:hypothetical protein